MEATTGRERRRGKDLWLKLCRFRMLIYIGKEVTPRCRAAIITMKSFGCSSRNIAAQTNVPKSTVNNIYRHALQNAARKRLEDCVSTSASGPETQAGPVRSAPSTGTQLQLPAMPKPKPVQASTLLPLAQAVPLRAPFEELPEYQCSKWATSSADSGTEKDFGRYSKEGFWKQAHASC